MKDLFYGRSQLPPDAPDPHEGEADADIAWLQKFTVGGGV